jgi:acyl-CoA synthetase (AMP-forming)/AMP-acid ligase II
MVGRLIQAAKSTDQYPLIFKQFWHTPRVGAGGYLHTSDIAMVHEKGYVHITDRIKDVGGEWVSSLQIEDLIAQCAGLAEAAVIGVKDDKWGERPLALVVKRPSDANGTSDAVIKDHLRAFADKASSRNTGSGEDPVRRKHS